MMQQASMLEGQYDQTDAINAAESTALGVSHCEKMKLRLNRQFQPQVWGFKPLRTVSRRGSCARMIGMTSSRTRRFRQSVLICLE